MSVSNIPESVKCRLWGKAAGRCQYEGCNKPLWRDHLTKAEFNTAYIAHVVADSVDGPRGHATRSKLLASDLSNLMLMCDEHHRLIDKGDVTGHPEDRLLAMKARHEDRIEILSAITAEKQSHVLLYGANIGKQGALVSMIEATSAMVPDWFPASQHPLEIGLGNSSIEDQTTEYWLIEALQIKNMVAQQVRPRIKSGEISHLSVFALAPQPLLMLLGSELSDIPFAETYQRHKEPQSWRWEENPQSFDYTVTPPVNPKTGDAALVFALSANVTDERISSVLNGDIPIWRVTIPQPDNDFLRSRAQTKAFRMKMRRLLDQIKAAQGEQSTLHVFPAMPVSLAVDFGRIINVKADMRMMIYDENKKIGGFCKALPIGGSHK